MLLLNPRNRGASPCIGTMPKLYPYQVELSDANDFIQEYHRHHKPVIGHRFSLGCAILDANHEYELVGVAVVGRPVSRGCNIKQIVEITRLCTNGEMHACSYLYAACARIAKDLGYKKIQTYILDTEPGTSLLAAGYRFVKLTNGGHWTRTNGATRRADQPECKKQLWSLDL